MGVLFFGSEIAAPSELWMRRMLDGLGSRVVRLALERDAPEAVRQKYATVVVRDSAWVWVSKVRKRLGWLPEVPATTKAVRTLVASLSDAQVTVALVHYLTTGVRYASAWETTAKPVFIHCHGFDVTWDLRQADGSGRPVHAPGYVDRVAALPSATRIRGRR